MKKLFLCYLLLCCTAPAWAFMQASISVSGNTRTVSGGSSYTRITLTDIAAATNSPYTLLYNNYATQTTAGEIITQLDTGSFSDLTGGVLFHDNSANNQEMTFRLAGDVMIGRARDLSQRGFRLYMGSNDIHNTHLSGPEYLDYNAKIVMDSTPNRFYLYHALNQSGSAFTAEPAARNPVRFRNNNADSKIRVTLVGSPQASDANYTLPSPNGFKPNGTFILQYELTNNVAVRDFEIYDGYIDWRPEGSWAPFTRGILKSSTWIKFLGLTTIDNNTGLVFGNQQDAFQLEIGIGTNATAYFLHGLYQNNDNTSRRIVYNNFSGISWNTQMAVYTNTTTRKIGIENHLSIDYLAVDQLASPLAGVKVILYKKDPVYDFSTTKPSISFPTETTIESNSNAQGEGTLGTASGIHSENIVVECFASHNGSAGNVDNAYANASHGRAAYSYNNRFSYSAYAFGKQILYKQTFTAKLAGQTGEGKQSLGTLQINDDTYLTATTSSTVATSIVSLNDFYDVAYNYAFEQEMDYLVEASAATLKLGTTNLVIDATATDLIQYTTASGVSTITIRSSNIGVGTSLLSITSSGTISTLNGACTEFGYIDANGENKYIEINGITNSDIAVINRALSPEQNIYSVIGVTGSSKGVFVAPSNSSSLVVQVRRDNYATYEEDYPEADLAFIRKINQVPLDRATLNKQHEMMNMSLKLLQKTEALKSILQDSGSTTLSVTLNQVSSTTEASVENQISIIALLRRMLAKVAANREALQ